MEYTLPLKLRVEEDSYRVMEEKFNQLLDYASHLHLRVAELERDSAAATPAVTVVSPMKKTLKKKAL